VGYNTNLEQLYNLANVYFPEQGENEEQPNENEEQPNDILGYVFFRKDHVSIFYCSSRAVPDAVPLF
jgi:hypothetical protein